LQPLDATISSQPQSQIKSIEPIPPAIASVVVNFASCAISKKGTFHLDISDDADAAYNPYMGDTWTRVNGKTGEKMKV
jgi:hypothetical protein